MYDTVTIDFAGAAAAVNVVVAAVFGVVSN